MWFLLFHVCFLDWFYRSRFNKMNYIFYRKNRQWHERWSHKSLHVAGTRSVSIKSFTSIGNVRAHKLQHRRSLDFILIKVCLSRLVPHLDCFGSAHNIDLCNRPSTTLQHGCTKCNWKWQLGRCKCQILRGTLFVFVSKAATSLPIRRL